MENSAAGKGKPEAIKKEKEAQVKKSYRIFLLDIAYLQMGLLFNCFISISHILFLMPSAQRTTIVQKYFLREKLYVSDHLRDKETISK